jgi:chromosome segregation ATPase
MLQKFDFLWNVLEKNLESTSSNFENLTGDLSSFRKVFNELVNMHLPDQWSQLHKYLCSVDNRQAEYEQQLQLVLAKLLECTQYCDRVSGQVQVAHDNMVDLTRQVSSMRASKSAASIEQAANSQQQYDILHKSFQDMQSLVQGYTAELHFVKDMCQQHVASFQQLENRISQLAVPPPGSMTQGDLLARIQKLEGSMPSIEKHFQKLDAQVLGLSHSMVDQHRMNRVEDDMRIFGQTIEDFPSMEERLKQLEAQVHRWGQYHPPLLLCLLLHPWVV